MAGVGRVSYPPHLFSMPLSLTLIVHLGHFVVFAKSSGVPLGFLSEGGNYTNSIGHARHFFSARMAIEYVEFLKLKVKEWSL